MNLHLDQLDRHNAEDPRSSLRILATASCENISRNTAAKVGRYQFGYYVYPDPNYMYPRGIKWSPSLRGNSTCTVSHSGLLYHASYTRTSAARRTRRHSSQLPGRATATLPSCTCASCRCTVMSGLRSVNGAIDTGEGYRYHRGSNSPLPLLRGHGRTAIERNSWMESGLFSLSLLRESTTAECAKRRGPFEVRARFP